MEACAALSHPGVTSLPSNQKPIKMDTSPITAGTGSHQTSIPPGSSRNAYSRYKTFRLKLYLGGID